MSPCLKEKLQFLDERGREVWSRQKEKNMLRSCGRWEYSWRAWPGWEEVHSNGPREGARSCGSLEAEGRALGRREPLRDLFRRLGKE